MLLMGILFKMIDLLTLKRSTELRSFWREDLKSMFPNVSVLRAFTGLSDSHQCGTRRNIVSHRSRTLVTRGYYVLTASINRQINETDNKSSTRFTFSFEIRKLGSKPLEPRYNTLNSYLPVDSPKYQFAAKEVTSTEKNFAVVAVVVKVTTFSFNYRTQLSRYRINEGKLSLKTTILVTLKTVGQFSLVFSTTQRTYFRKIVAQFTLQLCIS